MTTRYTINAGGARANVVSMAWLLLVSGCGFISLEEFSRRFDPDGDGTSSFSDCDETDPDFHVERVWYRDADGDGIGDNVPVHSCYAPEGYVPVGGDCDDQASSTYPGAPELCDGADNDCDLRLDENLNLRRYYADADGDGRGNPGRFVDACEQPSGYSTHYDDCDDTNAASAPGMLEQCDGSDNDCNGEIDEGLGETYVRDEDGDGYGAASGERITACAGAPDGYVQNLMDCDDTRFAVNPGATEDCTNGIDDNCDGLDENDVVYTDADGDNFGAVGSEHSACPWLASDVETAGDCNDLDAKISPGDAEECEDGIDNDCDQVVDIQTWWRDEDRDGFGNERESLTQCEPPGPGYTDNPYDCDDDDPDSTAVVDTYADPALADGTPSFPFCTIQDAIDAGPGCIVVLPGWYVESLHLGDARLILEGVGGSAEVTIDAGGGVCDFTASCAATIEVTGPAVVEIRGFTITGGAGHLTTSSTTTGCDSGTCTQTTADVCGGGIYAFDADLSLVDVVVSGHNLGLDSTTVNASGDVELITTRGGGLCVEDSSVAVDSLALFDNTAGTGGGVWIGEESEFVGEKIAVSANIATDGGGLWVDSGTVTIDQARFWCNEAANSGGAIAIAASLSQVTVRWLDMVANSAATEGGALSYGTNSILGMSSFIIDNDTSATAVEGSGAGRFGYGVAGNRSGSVWGPTVIVDSTMLSALDQHVSVSCDDDPSNDDFTLVVGAEAIDAGDPSDGRDDDRSDNDAGSNGGSGGVW